jgi:hypothetical protein
MAMSEKSIEEYTGKMRERYARMKGRKARTVLLDEFAAVTGWSRKHANKVLLGHKRKAGRRGRRGAPRQYDAQTVEVLKHCWLSMDQPCGKRMKDMLPIWLDYLEPPAETRAKLKRISAASIDRLLGGYKVVAGRKARPPKPASGVKSLVEIRAENWDTGEPGWTEVDTVAHCGGDMGGDFVWTLTSVDVASGWTELRAIWNRGQHACFQGLESICRSQPFTLLGVDSDNGGEFLNFHLYAWLKQNGIHQTRSRPYFKNDQAYVEQKNYTHVRSLLGYERIGHPELLAGLNELLAAWSLWKNLFCVTMKQESCHRRGSKQVRRHARTSKTPAQRLLESGKLSAKQKAQLNEQLGKHDPFKMSSEIRNMENAFWSHRQSLMLREEQDRLAPEGRSPLRSEQPSGAKKQQTTQTRRVS